jgi:glycosyltransferase involved in cell wall biosynthesis
MSGADGRRSFLILSANTPWVYALGRSLLAYGPVTAVRYYDWATYRRVRPEWPETESAIRRVSVTMPQGYAGALEPIFRLPMRRIVNRERKRLGALAGREPIVICPYPYLAPWLRQTPDEAIVYYNLDDYVLYRPSRAERITALENELVGRARLTICIAAEQVRRLSLRLPDRADRIRHFPLGVALPFLNPHPAGPCQPMTVGYVGNMSDRVDWLLVIGVAERMPQVKFHFVGAISGTPPSGGWQAARARALALPNVVLEGPVPQADVREHYWRYAVNWMPYDRSQPFNIASCPTKIMDALASGRPFVSTDIPEARLYPGRIHIAADADEAARLITRFLAGDPQHDPEAQVAFAATQTWEHRAEELIEFLS